MLNIIPFAKLHTYNVYKFLHKIINATCPVAVKSLFPFNSDVHGHNTRQSQNIHIQQVNCDARKHSLRHQASLLYSCGDHIAYDTPFVSFKYHVKNILLFN